MPRTWKFPSFFGQVKAPRLTGFLALLLAWTIIGVLSYTRYFFQATQDGLHPRLWPDVLLWIACFYPWVFLALPVFGLENRFRLDQRAHFIRNAFILASLGIPLCYVAFELRLVFVLTFDYFLRIPLQLPSRPWEIPLTEFFYHLLPYSLTLGASCILRRLGHLRERERETARLALEKSQLESSLRLAELEALRMKLNPHFLFNTLQNISVLAEQDAHTASVMITRLGDLLRASLRKDSQQEITLEAEIALTQAYLDVERMRFCDRLSVLVDIAPGTESALVPTLLLQPLVENAIKHGFTSSQFSGRIQIRSLRQLDRLVLTVADNGSGIVVEGLHDLRMGIGLGSTFERLQLLYRNQHEFTVRNITEGGTEVRISFPFRMSHSSAGAAHEHVPTLHRR